MLKEIMATHNCQFLKYNIMCIVISHLKWQSWACHAFYYEQLIFNLMSFSLYSCEIDYLVYDE